ncbi:metal ABC transporter ATP-binding protein [filamentous cyanobacterium LEGE 11480]|uniref:Metal ABC transporter ATP-binding protein n=2 Tax=Romeriopsis TaxID=2992131 RepID=A0A928Z4G7_9CYAN|nr:metal ABC transporter ATP-binding protein [Romeriopsis navalis LEGE 11480]
MSQAHTNPQTGIQIKHLSVVYPNGKEALHDANVSLKSGAITALVGMNGAGKSTLFKTIMGFLRAKTGQITIASMPLSYARKKQLVAYMPQAEDVDWNFPVSVWDVVMMGRYGYMNWLRIPRSRDRHIVRESIERVGLWELRDRQIGELSGGQKKRVFLARALAQQATILLLDEPFAGVDVTTERSMIELLVGLQQQGHTILISTHDLASIQGFCDQVILINRTILDYGETADVFTPENLSRAFGGNIADLSVSKAWLMQKEAS